MSRVRASFPAHEIRQIRDRAESVDALLTRSVGRVLRPQRNLSAAIQVIVAMMTKQMLADLGSLPPDQRMVAGLAALAVLQAGLDEMTPSMRAAFEILTHTL